MTQEEKQLLMKDLCSRLPYGVKLKIGDYSDYCLHGIMPGRRQELDVTLNENGREYHIDVSVKDVKPYLRPMSSMTEEERNSVENWNWNIGSKDNENALAYFDWLNEHYFDYRGLIEKGLALEAQEGMYK